MIIRGNKKGYPYYEGDSKNKSTPIWLWLITGFRRIEKDIWRGNFGSRKYLVRYWIFWIIPIYTDIRVFGSP